ncbi:MAG: transcriptional regulator [Actinomycetaceae bacterium]|nr:transcriptional regulator [Actinomycetaceae bacterium]
MTTYYLSTSQAAEHLGIKPGTFRSYLQKGLTPEPDAYVGNAAGWLPQTIDEWNAARPGRGARTDLKEI